MPYFYITVASNQNVLCPSLHILKRAVSSRGQGSVTYWCTLATSHTPSLQVQHVCPKLPNPSTISNTTKQLPRNPKLGSSKTIWCRRQISPFPLGLINTPNKHDPGVNSRSYYHEPFSSNEASPFSAT